MFPSLALVASGAAPGGTIDSITQTSSEFNLASGNWTNADLGPEPGPDEIRTIGLVWGSFDSSGGLTAITVNGVPLTLVNGLVSGLAGVGLAFGEVPNGTTNITVSPSWSGNPSDSAFILYSIFSSAALQESGQNEAQGVATDALDVSLEVSNPGVVISGAAVGAADEPIAIFYSELTLDVQDDIRTGEMVAGASRLYVPDGGPKTIFATTDGSQSGNFVATSVGFELVAP